MKLYSVDLSPYSAKVRMQLYAKGLEHVAIERPATFMTAAWRETSPIGRLPVLELDDGSIVPESDVIAAYVEEVFPTPSLLGATPGESADVRVLARLADAYLITNIFNLAGGQGRPAREGELRDRFVAGALRGLEALEQILDGAGGYACLGRMTLADCALVPALFMVENVLPHSAVDNPITASPKVGAYWVAIQSEPAAARVLAEMRRGLQARLEAVLKAEEAAG
jgi:glutathione S-transferase